MRICCSVVKQLTQCAFAAGGWGTQGETSVTRTSALVNVFIRDIVRTVRPARCAPWRPIVHIKYAHFGNQSVQFQN